MRRVTKVAIGAAIVGFAWLLFTRTVFLWWSARQLEDPDLPPTPGQEIFFQYFRQAQLWIPWLFVVLAIVLGATAFLTRTRTTDGDVAGPPPGPGT